MRNFLKKHSGIKLLDDSLTKTKLFANGVRLFSLKDTSFAIFIYEAEYCWARNDKIGAYQACDFEEVLDDVPEEIAEKLLFYLDLFS